jgi:hypothetical protein
MAVEIPIGSGLYLSKIPTQSGQPSGKLSRWEAQGEAKWSPDRKYITNDGNEAVIDATGLFWVIPRLALSGQVRYNWLWTSQFDKQGWAPSAGFVARDRFLGYPGRFYLDYLFATGCQWATASNPCVIQSNRTHGIEFFQEVRQFRHWRVGIRGAWYSFANQGNPQQPMRRVWNNTGTVYAVIRYEFRGGSVDESY